MLERGNMDNVVPHVQVSVQECMASGEHLCAGAVHAPAMESGCQVWISEMCVCASSSAVQSEQ